MLHSIFERAVRDQLILVNPCEPPSFDKPEHDHGLVLIRFGRWCWGGRACWSSGLVSGSPEVLG